MVKKLGKLVCILLCVFIAAALLCGCGDDNRTDAPPSSDNTQGGNSSEKPDDSTGGDNFDNNKPNGKPQWEEDGALKILAIGNSYSDDCMEYVYRIAESAGIENVKVANLYIGGCSIDMHVNNAKSNAAAYTYRVNMSGTWLSTANYRLKDAIESDNWDYITMQQASTYSGLERTYDKLNMLIEYVRGLCDKNTQFAWHMTWTYRDGFDNPAFAPYDYSQTKMYRAITDTVQKVIVPNDDFVCIIPTGTAIQNARTSYLGDELNRDGTHLTYDYGRYIAGLTVFRALTGRSLDVVQYAPTAVNADPTGKAMAVECAENAVKTPFDVTFSSFTDAPAQNI